MTIAKYRKQPVEIEAVQFRGSSTEVSQIKRWIETGEYHSGGGIRTSDMRSFAIDTLEGEMKVQPGDYVVRGVEGEFYPVKPSVFHKTYIAA